jgi:tripeptidyl-peptidase I
MVGLGLVLSALAAAPAALASPVRARTPYQVKETHVVPRGWTKRSRAVADHVINLQIGVKQGNFDELERNLYEGMEVLTCISNTCLPS